MQPAQRHSTFLHAHLFLSPEHTQISVCSVSLPHPLLYVGHSVYIDGYFQCLGPQEISLGNFQRTHRPSFVPRNWNGRFPFPPCSTSTHKWTQIVPSLSLLMQTKTLRLNSCPSGKSQHVQMKNRNLKSDPTVGGSAGPEGAERRTTKPPDLHMFLRNQPLCY